MTSTADRRLHVEHRLPADVPAPRGRFSADPSTWLPQPARYRGDGEWTTTVTGLALRQSVTCRVGTPWTRGTATWRSLTFRPVVEPDGQGLAPVLPAFHGEIGVIEDDEGVATVVLRGRYRPPGGRLGAAADALALQHVAAGTAQALVDVVAARLAETPDLSRSPRR
jgi:hypothetical protein